MREITITLPVPSRVVCQNASGKVHWRTKSKATKAMRELARLTCHQHPEVDPGMKFASYRMHFYFDKKRRRDGRNFGGRAKAYFDGISDYVGQDDSEWQDDGVRFHETKDKPRLEIVFQLAGADGGTGKLLD